jgi:phenylpyruvate tautomerase PptA (4-oxalocrotonate tautomerase family)
MNKVFDDVHTHEIFDGLTRDTKNKLIDAMTEVLQEVIKEDSKKLKKYLYQRS